MQPVAHSRRCVGVHHGTEVAARSLASDTAWPHETPGNVSETTVHASVGSEPVSATARAAANQSKTQQLSTVHCRLPASSAEAEACLSTRRALVPATRDWSAASALLCSLDYVPALCRCPCRTSNSLKQITRQGVLRLPCFRPIPLVQAFLGSGPKYPLPNLRTLGVKPANFLAAVMQESVDIEAQWNWTNARTRKGRQWSERTEIAARHGIT